MITKTQTAEHTFADDNISSLGQSLWFAARPSTSTLAIYRTAEAIWHIAAQFIVTEVLQQLFGQSTPRRIVACGFPMEFRSIIEQGFPEHFPRNCLENSVHFDEDPQASAIVVYAPSLASIPHRRHHVEGVTTLQFVTSSALESVSNADRRVTFAQYDRVVVPECEGQWEVVSDWQLARILREVAMDEPCLPINPVAPAKELIPLHDNVPHWYEPPCVSDTAGGPRYSAEVELGQILGGAPMLTVLFGEHGAGKTVLLTRVAEQVSQEGVAFYALATSAAEWSSTALDGSTGRQIARSILERTRNGRPNTGGARHRIVMIFDGVDCLVRHSDHAVLGRFATTAAALIDEGCHVIISATPDLSLGLMQQSLLNELVRLFIEDEGRKRFRELWLCPLTASAQSAIVRRFVAYQNKCTVIESQELSDRYVEDIQTWLGAATQHRHTLNLPLWTVLAIAHAIAHGIAPAPAQASLNSWLLRRIVAGEARRLGVALTHVEDALERAAVRDFSMRLGITTLTAEWPREEEERLLRRFPLLCEWDDIGSVRLQSEAVASLFVRKWLHRHIVDKLRRETSSRVPSLPVWYIPLGRDGQGEGSVAQNILQHVRHVAHAQSVVLTGEPGSGKSSVLQELVHASQADDVVLLPLLDVMNEWAPTAQNGPDALIDVAQLADQLLNRLLGTAKLKGAFPLISFFYRVVVLVDGFPRTTHDELTRARINTVSTSLLHLARLGVSVVVASLPSVEGAPNDPLREMVRQFRRHAPEYLCTLQMPPLSSTTRRDIIQRCVENGVSTLSVPHECQEFFTQLDREDSAVHSAFGRSPYWLLNAMRVLSPAMVSRLRGSKPLEMQRAVFVERLHQDGACIELALRSPRDAVGTTWAVTDRASLPPRVVETIHAVVQDSLTPNGVEPVSRGPEQVGIECALERLGFIRFDRNAEGRKCVTFSANSLREMWLADLVRCNVESLRFVPNEPSWWGLVRLVSQQWRRPEYKDAVKSLSERFLGYDPNESNDTAPICLHLILVYHLTPGNSPLDNPLRDRLTAHIRRHLEACYRKVQHWQYAIERPPPSESNTVICLLREGAVLLDHFCQAKVAPSEVEELVSIVAQVEFAQQVLKETIAGYFGGYERSVAGLCVHLKYEKIYRAMALLDLFELELIVRHFMAVGWYGKHHVELVESIRVILREWQQRGGLEDRVAKRCSQCRDAVDEYLASLRSLQHAELEKLKEQNRVLRERREPWRVGLPDFHIDSRDDHVN